MSITKDKDMTHYPRRLGIVAATIFAALCLSAALLPAGATVIQPHDVEFEAPAEFVVATASSKYVKAGIVAFEKRDFPKSVAMNKAALRLKPSGKTAAAAQSNLCATWAMLNDPVRAQTACEAALAINPSYQPAQSNKDLLNAKRAPK